MVQTEARPAPVQAETRGDVRILTLHNPPVNALSFATSQALLEAVESADRDDSIRAVVIAGAGGTFSGGADINEFLAPPPPGSKNIRDAIAALEKSNKTFVAAIDGNALGGGCELSLACDYRIATAGSKLGLPEIKLGLIPGAGGTQRLPRLLATRNPANHGTAGVQMALDFMLRGELKTAKQAKAMGLLDEVVEGDVVARGTELASEKAGTKKRVSALKFIVLPFMTALAHGMVPAEDKGGYAAHKLIDAVEAASEMEFQFGLAREFRIFLELVSGSQAQSAIHIFFAERELGKIPGIPAGITPAKIAKAAVIGAGTMGSGIAMVFASAQIPVSVVEVNVDAMERGKKIVADTYAGQAKKGRITSDEAQARTAAVNFSEDYSSISEADVVVEAVFESMEVKKQVFARLDRAVKSDAILASNTSTLDIDAIAETTSRPEKVVGLHFFAPANVMQLLEVVRGKATSAQTLVTSMALAKTLRKKGVLSGNAFGFIGNRMLFDYAREALYLAEEGALPKQVDAAIRDFGFPMGPFAMFDLSGLDVFYKIGLEAPKSPYRESRIVTKLYERGRYGQKAGLGFYRYESGSREPVADSEVEELIATESRDLGINRRSISDDEIVKRCMYALINQGAQLLGDGVALRPGDIDIVWIFGYGFPWWHGGPMWYADTIGVRAIYDAIVNFGRTIGPQWKAAPLLASLAERGGSFAPRSKVSLS